MAPTPRVRVASVCVESVVAQNTSHCTNYAQSLSSSLIEPGSTGPSFAAFTHGGLKLSLDELTGHSFCFDLEGVQTEKKSESRATPQRSEYDMVQLALVGPDETLYMRYVIPCLL